jgi:hypothetical protein
LIRSALRWASSGRIGSRRGAGETRTVPEMMKEVEMLDIAIVILVLLFFAASWLYVRACDRL